MFFRLIFIILGMRSRELLDLLEILLGNKEVIKERAEDWALSLSAVLCYCNPLVDSSQLLTLAKESQTDISELDPMAILCFESLCGNYKKFMQLLREISFPWLTAHIVDLLFHANEVALSYCCHFCIILLFHSHLNMLIL
jgi:hypothetical protein